MRFRELHIDRFGCFTDKRLSFSADAPLTLVYGANEAGKTTALAAIVDLLYGIEERSAFNFLHRYGDMCIGATITGGNGQTLTFRRRKRRQNSLVDETDTPIGDDALAPFLGNVSRALFLDAFGLDRARLNDGGRRLIAGGGDLADSLLAAAPGLSPLVGLHRDLTEECDGLFRVERRVSSLPFWQASERFAEARRRVREDTLQADTVRAAQLAANAARQDLADARAALNDLRGERARLSRLRNALPRIKTIDDLLAAIDELGPLPATRDDFPARCRDVLERRRELAAALERLAGERGRTREVLASLVVDDRLLARADQIRALGDDRANVIKAAADRPKLQGRIEEQHRSLADLAQRLGLADGDQVLARRPSDVEMARVWKLVHERRQLDEHRRERRERLAEVESTLEDIAAKRTAMGHVADPQAHRQTLERLAGLAERVEARDGAAAALKARERAVADKLQQLVVPVDDIDRLAELRVPDIGTVDHMLQQWQRSAQQREDCHGNRRRLNDRLRRLRTQIDELAAGDALPTPEAVDEARARRDGLWQVLRRALLEGEPCHVDDVSRFEIAVGHADTLADQRQREAERLATHRNITAEIATVQDELAAVEDALADLETARHGLETEWAGLWQPSGIEPRGPLEMRAWLQAREDLLQERAAIASERQRLEELSRRVDEAATILEEMAATLGLDHPSRSPLDRLSQISAAVNEMERRFQEARHLASRADDCEREARTVREAVSAVEARLTAWQAEWADSAPRIAVAADASIEEAEAALNAWQGVPAIEVALRDLEYRVTRIGEDQAAFEADVRAICADLAPDLEHEPAEAAAAELARRLDAAIAAATRREAHQAQAAELDERHARDEQALHQLDAALAELAAEAATTDVGLLGELADRLDRRIALAGRLDDERAQLIATSDGVDEAELREQLASCDPDALAARLETLEEEERDLQHKIEEGIGRRDAAEAELSRLESLAGAADAAQEEQNALAAIAGIIENWSLARAAERLLGAAIEAYRERHQNPALERAGQAFALVTEGAYQGIAADYDDDKPRLVAVRNDGQRLAVGDLSEGTADQLFLALRTAAIEDYATRATALPFIADDLFVTFDDARTVAGLRLLAELGRTTQVLVFTHHRHVVDAARTGIGNQIDLVTL